jgi:antitoxin CptB
MSEESRLRWLCRRGMKELDVIMSGYLENHYTNASDAEKNGFKALLEMPDPDLYALLLGKQTSSNFSIQHVAQSIRDISMHSHSILK